MSKFSRGSRKREQRIISLTRSRQATRYRESCSSFSSCSSSFFFLLRLLVSRSRCGIVSATRAVTTMSCQTKLRMHATKCRRRRWLCRCSRRCRLKLRELAYLPRRVYERATNNSGVNASFSCGRFLARCRMIIAASGGSSKTNDRSSRTTC